MRINIYAEEMTDRIEIFKKEVDGIEFEALRLYIYTPVTHAGLNLQGPFIHREGDDDSSAITFWSRGKLREVLQKAIDTLDKFHSEKFQPQIGPAFYNE